MNAREKKENIESRPVWKPMHIQPLYKKCEYIRSDDRDVSAELFEKGLCLPSGSSLSEKDQERVIDIVLNCMSVWLLELLTVYQLSIQFIHIFIQPEKRNRLGSGKWPGWTEHKRKSSVWWILFEKQILISWNKVSIPDTIKSAYDEPFSHDLKTMISWYFPIFFHCFSFLYHFVTV